MALEIEQKMIDVYIPTGIDFETHVSGINHQGIKILNS
jgi:hypothetical protein